MLVVCLLIMASFSMQRYSECCTILGVQKDANIAQIKKAYRERAIQYHPDKNKDPKAAQEFRKIKQSCDFLVENQHLKPKEIDSIKEAKRTHFGFNQHKPEKRSFIKGPQVDYHLKVSFEEILMGAVRKMKITRNIFDRNGMWTKESKVLLVTIKPGMEAGTRIVFAEEGDRAPNLVPGDVVFVVQHKPHPIFRCVDTVNLYHTVEIGFIDSLSPMFEEHFTVRLTTLEGKLIEYTAEYDLLETVTTEKRFPGLGLPYCGDTRIRGDIVIQFKLVFPPHLTIHKRLQMIQLLKLDL